MAASPRWKVFGPGSVYEASCKHLEIAAAVVAVLGEGATIRDGHKYVLWTEGKEEQPAAESYDVCAETCMKRVEQRNELMKGRTP